MGIEVFANDFATTLLSGISAIDTSATVASVPASLSTSGTQWRLLIESELVLVTAVAVGVNAVLTITRGIEGTTASSHGTAAVATHVLTSGALQRLSADPGVCECRLSLSSTLAVSASDITDASTIYLQPYKGRRIALYDGSFWNTYLADSFGSVASASLSGASGAVKDVFASVSGVTVSLSFVTWTNATTRSIALGTQDGVLVLSTDATKRYLGTIYFDALNGVSDSVAMRGCWNYYNQCRRKLARAETAASWTYTGTTFRQANANAANQVGVVTGIAETPVDIHLLAHGALSNGNAASIGRDGTTSIADQFAGCEIAGSGVATAIGAVHAAVLDYPTPGFHAYLWLETTFGNGSTASTFYGTTAGSFQSGLLGSVEG